MQLSRNITCGLVLAAVVCRALSASAINVTIDYTYDTTSFFGAGNPQGAAAGVQAKTSLEAAATFFSNLVTDSLSIIQTPPPFHSGSFDGSVAWQWSAVFSNPSGGPTDRITDFSVPANQYVIFAGARPLSGSEAGEGGPGGLDLPAPDSSGGFTPAELDQINQINDQFDSEVLHRDKQSGFADWGGTLAIDSDSAFPWHFDYTTPPEAGSLDFYSVALHELGHTLGFGTSDEWNNLIDQSNPAMPTFTGPASQALAGGPINVAPAPDLGHWLEGTPSKIYGTATNQETCMDPSLTVGTRKRFTALDVAALTDIGWSVAAPPVLVGDYNLNGIVDAADYTIWRDTLGSTTDLRANGNNTGASAGKIDGADYAAWKSNFGHTSPGAAAVPEPMSWLLLAIGGCAVSIGCRAAVQLK